MISSHGLHSDTLADDNTNVVTCICGASFVGSVKHARKQYDKHIASKGATKGVAPVPKESEAPTKSYPVKPYPDATGIFVDKYDGRVWSVQRMEDRGRTLYLRWCSDGEDPGASFTDEDGTYHPWTETPKPSIQKTNLWMQVFLASLSGKADPAFTMNDYSCPNVIQVAKKLADEAVKQIASDVQDT